MNSKASQPQVRESQDRGLVTAPTISLPKGGGAIRGIGEKFSASPVTGTGSLSVPVPTSPGRAGFGPQLALSYDSGAGNGPFGLGWSLSLPAITRKTDKGLPQYRDQDQQEPDVFLLSGAEDLVPVLGADGKPFQDSETFPGYVIHRYRPRIEGLFARIELWTKTATGETHWRSITRDNITTLYGHTNESRIFDPGDPDPEHPTRIFSWLISQSYDDKGNAVLYRYGAENDDGIDLAQPNERNRVRTANRYLKRVLYGNRAPNRDAQARAIDPAALPADTWMFEIVLDYGEHDKDAPRPVEPGTWKRRIDPFSTYRAGFEVRTYRRCTRILMFHHIPGDPTPSVQKGYDGLVRSMILTYGQAEKPEDARQPVYSRLRAVTQASHQPKAGGGYRTGSFPPLEFSYSDAGLRAELRELHGDSLENLPVGIDGAGYQWVDLDGEGISGVLSERDHAWYYKRNLSPIHVVGEGPDAHPEASFAPLEEVADRPATAQPGQAQFLDLAGDGRPDVVQFSGSLPGFYERTTIETWEPFVPFTALPGINWNDSNLKFVDLDGDGHTDLLISENDVFVWHRSRGEDGFEDARRVSMPWDEERGPRVVFANGQQSIYLADMSGDGLTDIARIRSGEICYWPNLGYGRFGAKVTMDHPPCFDHDDQFNQRGIRLADIDGSGTTDILYLHGEGVQVYFNQSGNGWSTASPLDSFPLPENASAVQVFDLLGNGTACLVWSSPLPGESRRPLRYLDLMGGQKPHLLTKVRNNLGAETTITYAPSTRFYLKDKQAGRPWITKLPFPVQCVEKVTVRDRWRGTRFTTTYSYHHGYFDGPEREMRGFGRVEQVDVEAYGRFTGGNRHSPYITDDLKLYQPPIKTVTWYHTGAYLDRERILNQYQDEYFPAWLRRERPAAALGPADFRENDLPEPALSALDLTDEERREALRACKGMLLRQEVYELDVDALERGEHVPVKLFSAAYHNCLIQRLQPRHGNRNAVFLVTESEAITYHYELDLRPEKPVLDPRVAHTLNLSIDEYGLVQQSVAVVYPRVGRLADASLPAGAQKLIRRLQSEVHMAYTETRYTNDVLAGPDSYRLRLPCQVRTYELTGRLAGISPWGEDDGEPPADTASRYFTLAELHAYKLSDRYPGGDLPVTEIGYHELHDPIEVQKRLVEHTRTLFFKESLDGPEPFGTLNRLGLVYETYRLALTAELLGVVLAGKLGPEVQAWLADKTRSGYLSGEIAGQYWACSGVAGFQADAPAHFYLPERYTDPFGSPTVLEYDPRDLYIRASQDALGSRTEVVDYDFRVLAPRRVKDINGNLSEARFDVLGLPAVMAVKGKGEGDTLDGFDDDALHLDTGAKIDFFVTQDYSPDAARGLLRGASARHLYYFGETLAADDSPVWEQHPPSAAGITREQHGAANSPLQAAFEYSDGAGLVLVKKAQAESAGPGGPLRWAASGKTIVNNKGKPVKQFEPYFSPAGIGHRYDGEEAGHEEGVTTVMYYDAAGRLVRTEAPDGSYSRVAFSPWQVATYDANDTLNEEGNAWWIENSGPGATAEERRAARVSAVHASTPSLSVLDSLGREVVAVAHNGGGPAGEPGGEKYVTFTRLDAEGKPLWVQDARGNFVIQYITPPLPDGPRAFDDSANLAPAGFSPCYDIAGSLLFQHGADSGERWMLNDAAGKPGFIWNSRGFITHVNYDPLHRPTATWANATGEFTLTGEPRSQQQPPGPPRQVEKIVYGDNQPGDTDHNLRGKMYHHFDSAGVVTVEEYDFKGNALNSRRELAADYKAVPDWSQNPALEGESFSTQTQFNAFNQPVKITTPDGSITLPEYNEAGLLNAVRVRLRGAGEAVTFVKNIDYNAKGQRERIEYGTGVVTIYEYDERTFRLSHLRTTRPGDPDDTASALFKTPTVVQDLRYTYDPSGNLTTIADAAHRAIFCDNLQIEAASDYVYDALYRLVAASGRERGGAAQPDWNDAANAVEMPPGSASALGCYVETYNYDPTGSLMAMAHHSGSNVDQPGVAVWRRAYQYEDKSSRLLATSVPGDGAGVFSAKYRYDAHGSMVEMPHLPVMRWDFRDQLHATAQQVNNIGTPETTYYVYDAAGQRVRKVTERQAAAGQTPTRSKERLYLAGVEIYREYRPNGSVDLRRESLHVMDDRQRIALVETTRVRNGSPVNNPVPALRYQLANHLGSASLELDEQARVISYEEYTPYGSTAYQAGRSAAEMSLKRYRYTGKEHDEESGLYYHGARYYAPWLGRWTSCDRAGPPNFANRYTYALNNPTMFSDEDGNWPTLQDLVKVKDRVGQTVTSIESSAKKTVQGIIDHPMDAAKGVVRGNMEMTKENVTSALGSLIPGPSPTTVAKLVTPEGRKELIQKTTESLTPPPVAAYKAYKKSREVDKNDVDVALAEGFMAAANKSPFFAEAGNKLYEADKAFQAGNVQEGAKQLTIAGTKYAKDVVDVTMMFEGAASSGPKSAPKMGALTEANLKDTQFYPGMDIKATTADIKNFTEAAHSQGLQVTKSRSTGTGFNPKTKSINLSNANGPFALSHLTDEFLHGWNQVWGRGRFLEAGEAGLHRSLGAEAATAGSKNMGISRNTAFHKLEMKNYLQSGQHLPGFMYRIGKEDLVRWANSHTSHH